MVPAVSEKYGVSKSLLITTVSVWLLFVGPAVSPGEAGEIYRRDTPHYVITTDIGEDFADLAARYMDSLYAEFERFFQDYNLERSDRASVRIFRRRELYYRAVPEPLRDTAGCFLAGENMLMTYMGNRSREDVLRTLAHEGFHQFLYDRIGDGMPLWLNEGLAEYYAEANWNGEGFVTGQTPYDRLHIVQSAIRSDTHMPLRELFRIGSSSWAANVASDYHMTDLQYCQSWSVVHFLLHAGEERFAERLHGYLRSLAAGEDRDRALRRHFGSSLGAMENAWRSYVLSLGPDPVSKCRDNMKVLLSIASMLYETPEDMENMDALTDLLLGTDGPQWVTRLPDGEYMTSDDNSLIKKVLRCDAHSSDALTGYTISRYDDAGLPELHCTGHEGLAVRAYLVYRQGKWHAESEVMAAGEAP